MVTSPYKWNFLELTKKNPKQANKQNRDVNFAEEELQNLGKYSAQEWQ